MDNQNQILRTGGLRAAPFGYRETPLSGPLSQSRRQMLSKKVELYKLHLIIETMILNEVDFHRVLRDRKSAQQNHDGEHSQIHSKERKISKAEVSQQETIKTNKIAD